MRYLIEAIDLLSETGEMLFLVSGCDHRNRPAMKRAFEGYDAITFGLADIVLIASRNFYRAFNSFRA